jgi:hypothetical protein
MTKNERPAPSEFMSVENDARSARREEAVALMLQALTILDDIGEYQAASRLSHAICEAGGDPPEPN